MANIVEHLDVLIGCGVIGAGIGYAACLWWQWRQARRLRQQTRQLQQEIADTLVKRLRALRKLRVVK